MCCKSQWRWATSPRQRSVGRSSAHSIVHLPNPGVSKGKPKISNELNGNTLITSESARNIREVNSKGETVWDWKQSDLPPGLVQQNTQSADRLANGNTVIFSSRSPKDAARPNMQAIEVTPDKKVVWVLQDWKNLGPATTAQFLDQPGIPENPGEVQH